MAKQLMVGQRAEVGDYIKNDLLRQKWVAEICQQCGGDGLKEYGQGKLMECPYCEGTKLYWKEVQYA